MFNVLLGDTNLSHMVPISPFSFTNSDVRLRIWLSDGTSAFQQLAPDQRISAVGYAMVAASVPDGSITAAKLADASITAAKLAPKTRQELGIPGGSVVLSDDLVSTDLTAAGFVRMNVGSVATEEWEQLPAKNPVPSRAQGSSFVWPGSELIKWGGHVDLGPGASSVNTGARYSLGSNVWTSTSTIGAPLGRDDHSSLWTGSEMLIWGGFSRSPPSQSLDSGGRYNPATDRWQSITSSNAPSPRQGHNAVWTGSEMIIWGGLLWNPGGIQYLNTGARYNPNTDTWSIISTSGAPTRARGYAAWTGTEMIVWGGTSDGYAASGGAIYNLSSDTWRPMSTNGAPSGGTVAVWIGTGLIVWRYDDGTAARYHISTDTWTPISPARPGFLHLVWAGTEVITLADGPAARGGGRYNPIQDQWTPITTLNAPQYLSSGPIWTGTDLLCFDGATLYKYRPSKPLYFYRKF